MSRSERGDGRGHVEGGYRLDVLDEGKLVKLALVFSDGVELGYMAASPRMMRELRDALTRAIVCAEVFAGMTSAPVREESKSESGGMPAAEEGGS